ncbi:MAG: helix-turn-helix domain-containing protein [Candidatus Fimisoma sp.]
MFYDPKETGKRIAKLRVNAGMTQEELAEKLNVASNYFGKIESGQRGCSIDMLAEISVFFNSSLDYLVFGLQLEVVVRRVRDVDENYRKADVKTTLTL